MARGIGSRGEIIATPTTTSASLQTATPTRRVRALRIILAAALAAPLAFGLAFAGAGFFLVFPPVVIGASVSALAALVALLIDRRWSAIAGAVVAGLVFLLGASDPTPGALWRPSLGMQMAWGHAARFAGLVGLAAGIAEARRLRGRPIGRLTRALPMTAALALGLAMGVGAVTSAALVDPGFRQGGTVVAIEPDATIAMVEERDVFELSDATLAPGALVRLVVENRDDALHSFTTTSGPAVDVDTLAARTTQIVARAPAEPGAWTFVCKYHPGMAGEIRVA